MLTGLFAQQRNRAEQKKSKEKKENLYNILDNVNLLAFIELWIIKAHKLKTQVRRGEGRRQEGMYDCALIRAGVCVCVSVAYRNTILYTGTQYMCTHKAKVDLVGQIRKEAKKIEWRIPCEEGGWGALG